MLRKSVRFDGSKHFFISNRGKEVTKVFDNVNKDIKLQNIRYQNREDGNLGELVKLSGKMIRQSKLLIPTVVDILI